MQNTILIHAPGRRQGRGALVLAYTALFALLMGIWAAIFALNGQSFIQYGDTLKQHYPFLVYYGRWLRQAARCVLTGAAVPTWDFSIGYGADIITTLSYYGLGDPLDLLAAFVPGRWTEQLLEGLIVLRLYLAGLAFMAFSRRHGNSRFGTLLGALAYVFSAWPIQAGLIEPVFLVPMYCFPLMLLGADDLFEGRSPVLYIAAIALTALSNFLFFYMAAVLLVLYAIAVYSKRYGAKNLRTLPPLLAKFIGFALVGIAISAVTLLPTAQELFGSARFGLTRETAPYPFYRFFELLANMTTGMGYDAYSTYAGVTSAAFLGVLVLVCQAAAEHRAQVRVAGSAGPAAGGVRLGGAVQHPLLEPIPVPTPTQAPVLPQPLSPGAAEKPSGQRGQNHGRDYRGAHRRPGLLYPPPPAGGPDSRVPAGPVGLRGPRGHHIHRPGGRPAHRPAG